MDVSEGGLCLLSPIRLETKQRVLLRLDVPRHGNVEIEAVAWHVRQVKSSRADRRAWSIGMMITKAGEGFRFLLPADAGDDIEFEDQSVAEALADMPQQAGASALDPLELDSTLEEDLLSAEELENLDLELLSPEELQSFGTAATPESNDGVRVFRVRVKAKTGPRTRCLTFGALSATEAETLARSELDESWIILEVAPA